MSKINDVSELRGPLGKLMDQLLGGNGAERLIELNLWNKGVETNLLQFVSTVTLPAIKRFSASEVLGRTGLNRDGVPVGYLSENFMKQFGKADEENVPEVELTVSCLERYGDAIEIAGAFPRGKRVTRISQSYQLVRAQEANGGSGPLLINGWANLLMAYGVDGNLWIVRVIRFGGGWSFFADPLGGPYGWLGGYRVFSQV